MRSLTSVDRCPECGLLVEDSLHPESLATAPAGWVRRQLIGVWLQFASYLLSAVSIFAEIFRSYVEELSKSLLMILRMTPLVGIALAVWLLTSPRPDRMVRNSTRLVRWGFAAVLVLAMLLPRMDDPRAQTAFARLALTSFFVLLVVCWIGLGCVQVRIARTLGLPSLGVLIWTASIVWSIALIATAAFYIFKEFTERSLFSRAEPVYVYTLMSGGTLLVISSLALAIAFTRWMRSITAVGR